MAIHEDITAQLESDARIAHMATHDFLTDLPNRYAFDSRLEIELTRARRLGSKVAVHWVDLDNFKDVNDTFGHTAGDELLVAVGRRLTETLRGVDSICRLGGDEFAAVQPDITSRKSAEHLAERLLRAFSESFRVGPQEIFASASIGISVSDGETTPKSEFMKQADLALYRAKSEGRNTYRFFEGEMDTEIKRRMGLAQDLHRAVERDELFLEYQPQIGLDDRRIVGVEALVRWQHSKLGVITPTEFVPIAESAGLIEEVGDWVLRAACRQAKRWQERGLPPLPVAVNISAIQLRDPRFVRKVSQILDDTGLEARYLELELTERVLMEGKASVERALETLDDLGIRISLDDFGKGYASLDYLRRYPLSKVKIDQSFVHDMETNFKNATIVSAVIDLATKLDLQVIAEGVEPADLLQRLIDEGCEEVQGFYFSRPVSAESLAELLTIGSDRIRAHPESEGTL
ncbi:MAG: EAL domain-containing protein [bacterium]|nr:EAL domain-containing protein [bacterium]